ncbi:hypothetical protein DOY81_005783 [Sarcophaga bullata]|nr:hypothetical protein DOY81_005783 [Sarcophaga bullata]
MLLNYFGQPTLLDTNKMFFNIEEFKESPILVSHKDALDGKLLPKDWSGYIYSTGNILSELNQKTYNNIKPLGMKTLNPNEKHNVCIGKDDSQCKVKDVELTAIPWNNENQMFLIKADNVTNLLTDMITNDMQAFIQNSILRKATKNGIDVLYINDGLYTKTEQLTMYPSECLLGALLTLVQPRIAQGLSGGENLPQCLINLCRT